MTMVKQLKNTTPKNKKVPISVFRTTCLELFDEVAETGEPVVITKRGKPIARLVPIDYETTRRQSGRDSKKVGK